MPSADSKQCTFIVAVLALTLPARCVVVVVGGSIAMLLPPGLCFLPSLAELPLSNCLFCLVLEELAVQPLLARLHRSGRERDLHLFGLARSVRRLCFAHFALAAAVVSKKGRKLGPDTRSFALQARRSLGLQSIGLGLVGALFGAHLLQRSACGAVRVGGGERMREREGVT